MLKHAVPAAAVVIAGADCRLLCCAGNPGMAGGGSGREGDSAEQQFDRCVVAAVADGVPACHWYPDGRCTGVRRAELVARAAAEEAVGLVTMRQHLELFYMAPDCNRSRVHGFSRQTNVSPEGSVVWQQGQSRSVFNLMFLGVLVLLQPLLASESSKLLARSV